MVAADFVWSDIGSWTAVREVRARFGRSSRSRIVLPGTTILLTGTQLHLVLFTN